MSREEEIMLNRRIKGMGYTIVGLVVSFVFLRSISSGYFDDLKTLNSGQDELVMASGDSDAVPSHQTGNSQLGEQLFKMHCNSCHLPFQDATGPALVGARGRWLDQSSEENFYDWVRDSKSVIDAGDPYANKLFKKWKKTPMPAFNLTNEEIDEIFVYIN